MAYKDCPCHDCKDRATGTKRVACHSNCEEFMAWKTKQQKEIEKRKDKPYYSDTRMKFAKRKMMNRKAGRP